MELRRLGAGGTFANRLGGARNIGTGIFFRRRRCPVRNFRRGGAKVTGLYEGPEKNCEYTMYAATTPGTVRA